MKWDYSTVVWAVGTVIVPVVVFLSNVAIRYKQKLPQSSASDFILLLIAYTACVIADPSVVHKLVTENLQAVIVPLHLAFLLALGLAWIMSVLFIEERLSAYHYSFSNGQAHAAFPYLSWFVAWVTSVAVLVVYLFIIGSS